MNAIADHKSLIDALGGNKVVSDHLVTDFDACPPVRVGQWKLSNSIPNEYWPEIIRFAKGRGLTHIDAEWMMNSAPKRRRANPEPEPAPAQGKPLPVSTQGAAA